MMQNLSSRSELTTWIVAISVALLGHAALALAVFVRGPDPVAEDATAGAMVVELASVAVARSMPAEEIPVGADQIQGTAAMRRPADATPDIERDATATERPNEVPDTMLPKALDAEAALPLERPPVPPETASAADAHTGADVTSASHVEASAVAEKAAASSVGGAAKVDPRVVDAWNGRLAATLEKNKRFPAEAKARNQPGTVEVSFVIDREGRLTERRITRSSKVAALDAEALALLERCQPFPVPPKDLAGTHFSFSVPIQFNIR